MVDDLGLATTLIIGFSIGFGGFALLIGWIRLFFKSFDANSKLFWALFWINMIFWVVGALVVPMDFLDDTIHIWGKPSLVLFMLSLVVNAIVKLRDQK